MKQTMRAITTLSALLLCGLPNAGFAQKFGDNEMVVTATRIASSRDQVPACVTVIGKEIIASSPASNCDDLLRSATGVSILRNYGAGYGIPGQINVRGIPGLHGLLLLADGLPLNEAATGFLNPNEIPLCAIRKVEFVRGPFSALYGADALSGVVNVLLIEPGEYKSVGASASAGNYGLRDYSVLAGGRSGKADYVVAVERFATDNLLARDEVLESRWDPAFQRYVEFPVAAENYDYSDARVLGKIRWNCGDRGSMLVHVRWFDARLGYGRKNIAPLYPDAVDNITENSSAMMATECSGDISENTRFRIAGSCRRQTREVRGLDFSHMSGAFPVYARTHSQTVCDEARFDSEADMALTDVHTAAVGLDARFTAAELGGLKDEHTGLLLPSSSGKDADARNVGLYVQDSATLRPGTKLVAGARIDSNSSFGETVSPKIGLVRKIGPDRSLHLAAGRAYRAPSLLELHQPDIGFGQLTFRSNPKLEPEYVNSADAGVEYRFNDSLAGRASAFYNDMDDLIGTRAAGQVITYENVDNALSRGVEAGLDWNAAPGVVLFAACTLQRTEDKATNLDLPFMPDTMFNAGIRVNTRAAGIGVSASAVANRVGERGYTDELSGLWKNLDDYSRLDLALKLDMNERFAVGLTAQNVTDEEYQESSVVNPAPGRIVALRVEASY